MVFHQIPMDLLSASTIKYSTWLINEDLDMPIYDEDLKNSILFLIKHGPFLECALYQYLGILRADLMSTNSFQKQIPNSVKGPWCWMRWRLLFEVWMEDLFIKILQKEPIVRPILGSIYNQAIDPFLF